MCKISGDFKDRDYLSLEVLAERRLEKAETTEAKEFWTSLRTGSRKAFLSNTKSDP